MNTKFLLLIILVFASLPRSIELLNQNYLFGFDQGLFLQAVKKIVIDHKPTLIGAEVGGAGGFFQGPGWYYLLSLPFAITNGNPYGAMVLMFLVGISTIYFSYLFTRKMFDIRTAFFVAFLIGVSPAIIPQSRFIWPPFPISLITVFFVFFLYKVFQKKSSYFPLVTFIIGLISHFEMAVAGSLLALVSIMTPLLYFKKYINLRTIFFSLLSFSFTLFPLLLFDLRHGFINTKGVLSLLTGANTKHEITFIYMLHMFRNHLDVFKFSFLSVFTFLNYLWPFILLIFTFGSMLFLKDTKNTAAQKSLVLFLVLSPLFLFTIFMWYKWPMWEWWIVELPIFYCFLLAILFGYLWRHNIFKIFITLFITVSCIHFVMYSYSMFKNDFNDFGGMQKIKGKLQAIDYIYQDAKGKPFGLLVFTPPIYTFAYDYLLWWHGERKYNYLPYQEKKGTFYLLIEPDPHKPWTYKGWLETVVKTGKVIEEKKLPSGFIIQKRLEET